MSFFGQKGDDSNLQYDDTAFLYFIASFVSIGAVVSLVLVVKDLLSLSISFESKLSQAKIFNAKIQNLKKEKKRAVLGKGFFIKLVSFVVLTLLFKVIYDISSQTQNKLKGFDPFEILGIPKDATLRDVKKAYRKLALEFHPDKNIGNPQAQNKFILISKSYQCFTDEKKKANCFKYGNPDGEGSFRVGIGLPQFFINVEYEYYVLPIVLTIFLVLIPWGMISWNNKTKVLDHDGISINSYHTFFKCFANKKEAIDKFIFLYILTSFPELYEDPDCRPITPEDKQELQKVLGTLKIRKEVFDQLSVNQLDILWQLLNYCSNRGEFRTETLRKKIEYFLGKTVNMILMFATKPDQQGDLIRLYDNPEWQVRYIGPTIIESYLQFERDYYNRTLLVPRSNVLWIHSLDLDDNSKNAILQGVQSNIIPAKLYETITSPEKIAAMCDLVGQQQKKSLENQLKDLPIYQVDLKIKVGGEQKATISNVDYAQIFFRVRRTNKTSGYTLLKNYPYPKKNSIYILAIQNGQILLIQKIDFPYKQDEFVQKIDYRTGKLGNHMINIFCINQSYFQIDTFSQLNFKVTKVPEEELQRPIQYHPDDIHMEKLYKNFFETLIELDIDPEENELSDSDEEEEIQRPKKKKRHNHQDCDSDSGQSSDEVLD